LKTRRQN